MEASESSVHFKGLCFPRTDPLGASGISFTFALPCYLGNQFLKYQPSEEEWKQGVEGEGATMGQWAILSLRMTVEPCSIRRV